MYHHKTSPPYKEQKSSNLDDRSYACFTKRMPFLLVKPHNKDPLGSPKITLIINLSPKIYPIMASLSLY